MDDEDRYTRITLRIPKTLHADLTAEADRTSKSLNAEIVARLEQSFTAAQDADTASLVREMRRTQVHLELNSVRSAMANLFARGQEIRAVLTRLEATGAEPAPLEAAKEALAAISSEKKRLDVTEARLFGELSALNAQRTDSPMDTWFSTPGRVISEGPGHLSVDLGKMPESLRPKPRKSADVHEFKKKPPPPKDED
ncbi:toxin-antitoxin system HicB family antitoxin [Variovorax paradoxus]|nr:toxin-antitoxin system HicB family antitoxin [Variovorax paradoxus]